MRPVNLIPPEERSGARVPMRGGPLAYIIVGALAAAVIGVAALAMTSNQISDSKAEIATLEEERSAVEARAQALDAYTQFHSLQERRTATIASLADSRFDWQRVMHELSLILPHNVWLTTLSGTARPGVAINAGAGSSLRGAIPGPALELNGCASSQDAVAGFIQALKEIDGVTRVGVQSSALPASGSGESSSGGESGCQTRDFIAQFQMVVAFDAAPVSSETGETSEAAPAPTETVPASSEETAGG